MKKKTILLLVIYFILGISLNIIHPITPNYVDTLGLNDFYYGLLFSIMSLGQFTGALIFGRLSDKFGRISILVIGVLGYALFQFLFGYVNTIPLLILAFRFFGGFFASAPNVLFLTFINDLETDSKVKAKAFSLFTALYVFGSAIGYKVGGFLYAKLSFSFLDVFLTQVAILVFIAIIMLAFFFKESKNKQHIESRKLISINDFKEIGLKNSIFFLLLTLLAIGEIMVTKYIEKYMIFVGYNADDLGTMMMVTALLGLLANIILSRLIKKFNISYPLYFFITMVVMSVMIILTMIFPQTYFIFYIYSFYAIFVVAKTINTTMESTMINNMGNETNHGMIMGIRQSCYSLGSFIGPLIGGAIYSYNKFTNFYVAGATIFVISCVYLLLFIRKSKVCK